MISTFPACYPGIVLLVVTQGGLLLALDQITTGDLMSFLVATQTIQRLVSVYVFVCVCTYK